MSINAHLRTSVAALAAFGLLLHAAAARAEHFDLATATIGDIQAAVDAGALSYERLVQLYLNRIEAYNDSGPALNSIITVNADAIGIARALDREREVSGRRSMLHGIPVAIKDLVNTHDMQTTGGFVALQGAVPAADAHVVRELRDAGAIIFAKTNMSDWLGRSRPGGGSSIAGQVVNPYDLRRTIAPSSSGTGASIAAWFATTGIGSETGTSIRNPTTDGSLVGLAPTEGLIGRSGAMANTFTHERLGPMVRSTLDLAVMLDHMVGLDIDDLVTAKGLIGLPAQSYTSFLDADGLRGARIGVLRDMLRSGPAHAEGLALAEKAFVELHAAGAQVVDDVSLDIDFDRVRMLKVNYWEARSILDKYLADYGPDAPFHSIDEMLSKYPQQSKPSLAEYAGYEAGTDPEYRARLKGRRSLRDAVVATMDRFELDALVFPYKTLPARLLEGDMRRQDAVNDVVRSGDRVTDSDNYLSSMTGLPSVLVPMGYVDGGAALALEFLGRPFSEPTLLRLASGYEARTTHRRPPRSTPPLPGESFDY